MPTINGKACVANGRNLYTDTKNFDNLASWLNSGSWTKTTDTYNGLAVMQTTQYWNGLCQYIQVKKGDILTYSVYAKNISGTGSSNISWMLNSQTEGTYSQCGTTPYWNTVTITDSWQRVSGTVVATSDGYLRPRLERTGHNTNILQIAGIKVEKGSVATPLTPAPVDKVFSNGRQVYGRNLLTGTGNHTFTGAGAIASGYLSNETTDDLLNLFKGLEGQTVTVSVDYEYSGFVAGGTSAYTDRLGWEIQILGDTEPYLGPWYNPNNASGSGRTSSTFVVPKNITGIINGLGYIEFPGSGTGTVSHLKLEKGSVATPWTPAPEDVM